MFGTFMLNLLCAVVPCDPQFRLPEIANSLRTSDSRRFATPEIKYPVVLTQNGAIQGYSMYSSRGNRINAFEGIPYGEAPVGYFRFRVGLYSFHNLMLLQYKCSVLVIRYKVVASTIKD